MRVRWFLAALPAVVGLATMVLTASGRLPNPIFYLRADLGMLALLGGSLLSMIGFLYLLRRTSIDRSYRQDISQVQNEAAEERRRFLRRLDHEMKNPLTAIRAGLTNVLNDSAAPAQQEALASVEAQVMRLSRLTADLRKLAELESRPLERTSVDIAEILREAVALSEEQPEAETRHLNLMLPQAPWPLPAVSGDWDLILLAVYNLLNNALKFTRPGDTVEVRAFEDGTFVNIEVADTGPGIPEEELPHVGEELYRGQGARGVPGSGLGMALVRAIVDRHAGQVTIRSRVRQGTVVNVRFPVH